MFIHNKLKKAREDAELSQETLVYKLRNEGVNITRQTLGNYEKGITTPEANILAGIAIYLNKPITFFFDPIVT